MSRHSGDLKFPEWLTDELLDELNQLGFDCDISWDSMGKITLHIWKMTEKDRAEADDLQRFLNALKKLIGDR